MNLLDKSPSALIVPAFVVGSAAFLFQRYETEGHLDWADLLYSGASVALAVVIMALMLWWGHRPQKIIHDHDESMSPKKT